MGTKKFLHQDGSSLCLLKEEPFVTFGKRSEASNILMQLQEEETTLIDGVEYNSDEFKIIEINTVLDN